MLAREFVWGGSFPEPVALIDHTGLGDKDANTPEVLHYVRDELGSVVGLTDAGSGGVGVPPANEPVPAKLVERYDYDPYGRTYIEDPNGVRTAASRYGNPLAWTAQRYDAGVKLYGFFARTYSPELGRWLQRDPAGHVDGTNLYQYVRSMPTKLTDPFGLISDDGSVGGAGGRSGGGDRPAPPPADGPKPGVCGGGPFGDGLSVPGGLYNLPPWDFRELWEWIFGPSGWLFGTRYATATEKWGFLNGGAPWGDWLRLGWSYYAPYDRLLFALRWLHSHYYMNHMPWWQPAAYGGFTVSVTVKVLGIAGQVVAVVTVAVTAYEAGHMLGEGPTGDVIAAAMEAIGQAMESLYEVDRLILSYFVTVIVESDMGGPWVAPAQPPPWTDERGRKYGDCRWGCHGGSEPYAE